MSLEISNLNNRMANMEFLFGHSSVSIVRYEAPLEDELRLALLAFFKVCDLGPNHFSKFRRTLGLLYRAARRYAAPVEEFRQFWQSQKVELDLEFRVVQHYLNADVQASFNPILRALEQLEGAKGSALADALEAIVSQEDCVLLPEHRESAAEYNLWLESIDVGTNSHAFASARLIAKQQEVTKRLIVVGAPRAFSQAQLRTALFGGLAPEITFVTPNWWVGSKPEKSPFPLFPGIDEDSHFEFSVSGPEYTAQASDITPPEAPWFSSESSGDPEEIESFLSGGEIACRVLSLAGGLAIAVEEDASDVTVLEKLDDGTFKVRRVDIQNELLPGFVICELATAAESDFLWASAQDALGEQYLRFESLRQFWLGQLRNAKVQLGSWHLKKALKEAGVSTSGHALEWLADPNFTKPRSNSDFKALLGFLGLNEIQRDETIELTRIFRSKLSSLGQQARDAMAEIITEDEWADVQIGHMRRIKLEDFGDAEFQLVIFESLQHSTINLTPNQVRRVIKDVPNGQS
jgi:hypothetical protein